MQNAFKETKLHGKPDFPYEVYNSFMPKFFTYFPLHWHDEFEIIYVIEGKLAVNVQGKAYILNRGDILIVAPDVVHDMAQIEGVDCHYTNIMFTFGLLESNRNTDVYKKYFEPFFSGTIENPVVPAGTELNSLLTPYVYQLWDKRHEKYETDELLVKSNLYAILYYCQSLVHKKEEEPVKDEGWIERIKPVLSYVSQHLAEELTVEQASKMCCFSESHFMKVFKSATGSSFLEYVKKCRLEYAYYLLTSTNESISVVGEKSGFNNFSYFIRSFKAAYGKSPLQFRKDYAEVLIAK